MMNRFTFLPLAAVVALGHLTWAAPAAAMSEFYVGVDGTPTLTSGTYKGLANPNYGRLTFLYAHPDEANPASSHYHGTGAYSYTGTPPDHSVLATNGNNRIPEMYTGQTPLELRPGSGLYAGRQTTGAFPGEHYSDLGMRSTHELAAFAPGTTERYLFDSSGGRWNGSLAGSVIGLELVSKSAGLHVGSPDALDVLAAPGDRFALGAGESLNFTPVLWTDGDAVPGTYSATFRLVDLRDAGTPFGDSGTFSIDTVAVPEPGSVALLAAGAAALLRRRRQRA